MILNSYDRRRRVASRVPLAPSPTTPEFLAVEALRSCRRILVYRSHEAYWKGFYRMVAHNKSQRLSEEDDVIVAANTIIKMNRGLA